MFTATNRPTPVLQPGPYLFDAEGPFVSVYLTTRGSLPRLVQDSDGPATGQAGSPSKEHRSVPPEQVSPYGPGARRESNSEEPTGRAAEGD